MPRATLVLHILVTYETNDTPIEDLQINLLDLATRGLREGWFTGDTDARVIIAAPSVEEL